MSGFSVPLFKFFDKQTRGFFRREKRDGDSCNPQCKYHDSYAIGQRVQCKISCCDGCCAKVIFDNTGENFATNACLCLERDGAFVKFIQDVDQGFTMSKCLPKFKGYDSVNIKSMMGSNLFQFGLEYNPKTYYNASFQGVYIPTSADAEGARVCRATAAFACGDEGLKLNVGGEITVTNTNSGNLAGTAIENYRLGFLYQPSDTASYSVLYTPDRDSNGLDFSLSCFKSVSDNLDIAARAEGKVDIQKSAIDPVLSFGTKYQIGENKSVQGFMSSNKQYGIACKTKISDAATVTFGVANYFDENRQLSPSFGYKLEI